MTSRKNTLDKAREEVRELLRKEHDNTLDKQQLETGLKQVERYLNAMYIHDFDADPC